MNEYMVTIGCVMARASEKDFGEIARTRVGFLSSARRHDSDSCSVASRLLGLSLRQDAAAPGIGWQHDENCQGQTPDVRLDGRHNRIVGRQGHACDSVAVHERSVSRLAVALHELLGWRIVVAINARGEETHFLTVTPEGKYADIRGLHDTISDVRGVDCEPEYVLQCYGKYGF